MAFGYQHRKEAKIGSTKHIFILCLLYAKVNFLATSDTNINQLDVRRRCAYSCGAAITAPSVYSRSMEGEGSSFQEIDRDFLDRSLGSRI